MNTVSLPLIQRLELKQTILMLAASLLLPFLIHQIPIQGEVSLGIRLLPIFYAPMLAALLFRFHVGVIVAALAPVLNYWLTGMPTQPMLTLLTVELVVFVTLVYLMRKVPVLKWINAPLACVLALGVASLLVSSLGMEISSMAFFKNAIMNSWPGIAFLALLNHFLIHT